MSPVPPTPERRIKTAPRPLPRAPAGTASRALAIPFSILYAGAARWRARRWRGRGRHLPHPVLSVGNLTFGGTGKTPFVVYAVNELRARGRRPGVLSRGYKARGPEGNDEAAVLARHLPDVPHVQDPDRHGAGLRIADRVDCYVLDDGFQHLPLFRDLDIVLIDATDPFGGGYCPPAGRLREPLSALSRAGLVVLTRQDFVSRGSLGETMRRVRERTRAPVATGDFPAECACDLRGAETTVACGIGNPAAFLATVERLGARVAERRIFPDHHAYDDSDAAELARSGRTVVVTEKDAVKLEPIWPGPAPLAVVKIHFEPRECAAEIARALDEFCRR